MGFLHIGSNGFAVQIEDRALAHVKIIILSELRKGRGLAFSRVNTVEEGSGRDTFWIHPNTDLRFQFHGNRAPHLNKAWLQAMVEACQSGTGLYVMDEPRESQRDVPSARSTARL